MILRRPHSFFAFALVCLCAPALFGKPRVIVSIPPQKAFVEAVAGNSVEIQVLLLPGQNPASFTLSPKMLSKVAKADVYFSIGAPMEDVILPRLKASYPNLRIIDTTAGIRKRTLEDHSRAQPDPIHTHAHTDDPHIWLSPGLVKIQLRHYTRTLKELVPGNSAEFDINAKSFLEKLELLDNRLAERLKHLAGNTVFVYHPAFGYFLDRYGLRQETVELQGKQPSPKQLQNLISLAKDHQVTVIFVQPQFHRNSAQTLAKAIGGQVEVMDPLAENYLDNLRHMGETIAESYH
jgi:zinc transport system substrate-binding protein